MSRNDLFPSASACAGLLVGVVLGTYGPRFDTTVPDYQPPAKTAAETTDWVGVKTQQLQTCEAAIEVQRLNCLDNPEDLDAWLLWTDSVRSNCDYTRDQLRWHQEHAP